MTSDYRRAERAIIHLVEHREAPPSLEQLAKLVELSPSHFQRLFRRMTGVSPKRFSQALNADHAEALLRDDRPALDAAHAAGLSGSGRLYELMVSARAMTPGEVRAGGAGLSIRYGVHATPLGDCLVAQTPRGICELAFVGRHAPLASELNKRWPNATLVADQAGTELVARAIFAANREHEPITLHLRGTNFQLRVWQALLEIPIGGVASYKNVASRIGDPRAARAVGNAVGRNPVAVLVPCHRVLQAQGAVGQYRWGAPRKRALLAYESALVG